MAMVNVFKGVIDDRRTKSNYLSDRKGISDLFRLSARLIAGWWRYPVKL